jgi:hypothetical protein
MINAQNGSFGVSKPTDSFGFPILNQLGRILPSGQQGWRIPVLKSK